MRKRGVLYPPSKEQLHLQALASKGMAYGDGNGKLVPLMQVLRDRLRAKAAGGARQMFKMFKEMDLDGNGTIDAAEFSTFLKYWNIPLSEAKVHQIMKMYDKDGDGTIDYYEFVKQVLPEDYPSNISGEGARASWMKPDPGWVKETQVKKFRERNLAKILAKIRAGVSEHPKRDALLQEVADFLTDKTGLKHIDFNRVMSLFDITLSVEESKLAYQSGCNSVGRLHMKAGDVSGCGRVPMFNMFKLLLGSEKALKNWLDRNGHIKSVIQDWNLIPVQKTEYHREGLPTLPKVADHSGIPVALIDQAENDLRAKLASKCGNGQWAPFKVFRAHMPVNRTGNQHINMPGFRETLRMLGLKLPEPVLCALFARYDKGDGLVDVHQLQRAIVPMFETQFPRIGLTQATPIHTTRLPSTRSSSCPPGLSQTVPNSKLMHKHRGVKAMSEKSRPPSNAHFSGGRWYPSAYLCPPPPREAFGANRPPADNILLLYKRPASREGEAKPHEWPAFEC